jgi:colanic acid/amylovoran biosynthesis glycosyltransferase
VPNSKSVLIITSTFPFGHGEEFVEAEIRGLLASGMNVILIPLWPRGSLRQGASDLKHITLRRTKVCGSIFLFTFLKLIIHGTTGTERKRLNLIRRYFRESISAAYGPQLSKIIIDFKVSHVHAYWASGPAMLAMNASRLSGINWSFSGHSGDLVEGVSLDQKIESCSGVRLISKRGSRILNQVGFEADSSVIIHLGVEVPATVATQNQISDFKIACVGNLIPIKNHITLFNAIKVIESEEISFSVDIIGLGPLESKLKKSVKALGLEKTIFFRGQIDHAQLMAEYSQASYQLIILASGIARSGQQEGIPVSLMEAMSYGIPVVSTNTGGIPELITKEFDLLVPPGDSKILAKKILEIVNMPPDDRNELGVQCRSRIIESFNVVHTSNSFEKWLHSLME